jgi:hypothetical protein
MNMSHAPFKNEADSRFKLFHELMKWKVRDILLVSTPYDAWVLEEDCRLSERIVSEYRGLNLSKPPRFTWVPSAEQALSALKGGNFDMVLTMSRLADMDPGEFGRKVKVGAPDLPVILLSHAMVVSERSEDMPARPAGFDQAFVWSGDTDILVALVKSAEDRMNVERDTRTAGIRVILLASDSPYFVSSVLPALYREVVCQIQSIMESGLNEEHRLLTMRARPKILITTSIEEAQELFTRYEPYVLGVISDLPLRRGGLRDPKAGSDLLAHVRRQRFDIPLLLAGSDRRCEHLSRQIQAAYLDRRSAQMRADLRNFLKLSLGFGDFIFRMPDGREIARAANLRDLADGILKVPQESFLYHSQRNDFSRWLFARTEILLASDVRPISHDDFPDVASHREHLSRLIQKHRQSRHQGVVVNFETADFDPQTEFAKIGKGSLGGKARGLAFLGSLLRKKQGLAKAFENVNVHVPQTLVITTDGFESFIEENNLFHLADSDLPDAAVAEQFLAGRVPGDLTRALRCFLAHADFPLAVRSSSLLEDAQHHAYAGLYRTYMLPNDQGDLHQRLWQLLQAVKLVYASTYFQDPRTYARRVGHQTAQEKMAVVIQKLVGRRFGDFYYPAISGVAQSHNYYPMARMKPEDGAATIALGLGKMVVGGQRSLRFCPRFPKYLPQRSSADDILNYAQRHFYALQLGGQAPLGLDDSVNLVRREISSAIEEKSVLLLASTYVAEEHRIRDTVHIPGTRLVTFAGVIKHGLFPLAELISQSLTMGQAGMGCPVEIEFSVNLPLAEGEKAEFAFLQMRPMTARADALNIHINPDDINRALLYCTSAMGNVRNGSMRDIIYVKPDVFDASHTVQVARQVAELNAELDRQGRKYVLIGPGRWGSEDRWLGIPVQWSDICGVGAIVETTVKALKAEPSQGSHFFHNLASLGVSYLCVKDHPPDFIHWQQLTQQPAARETEYLAHIHFERPLEIKVDGRSSKGLIILS